MEFVKPSLGYIASCMEDDLYGQLGPNGRSNYRIPCQIKPIVCSTWLPCLDSLLCIALFPLLHRYFCHLGYMSTLTTLPTLAAPKARFPLGEFVRANRQKSRNASYLFAANFFASQF